MDKRQRQIDNWAQATRATRQDITKNGASSTESIVAALKKAAGYTDVADPNGHDHRLKKSASTP